MITLEEYFGKWIEHPDATDARKENARKLLTACTKLEALARIDCVQFRQNPTTHSQISGSQYGGFRPQEYALGAAHSAHKEGLAVDIYDPDGKIDAWCMANQEKLKQCGIYIEHPYATLSWSHWTIRPPASGNTVFYP